MAQGLPKVTLVVRGRFQPLPSATLTKVSTNAWSVRIPKGDPIHAAARRPATPEGWDGAIFALDGKEAEPALGSGEDASAVVLTLLVF